MRAHLNGIVETIQINAPSATVWRFLVEPARAVGWLGCMRFAGTQGSVFYMQMDQAKREADDISGATHCEIIELVKGKRMVFSWYLPGTPTTTVSVDLMDDQEGGTIVTLVHSGWDRFDADAVKSIHSALSGGWKSFVLPGLKRAAEA